MSDHALMISDRPLWPFTGHVRCGHTTVDREERIMDKDAVMAVDAIEATVKRSSGDRELLREQLAQIIDATMTLGGDYPSEWEDARALFRRMINDH